MNAGERALKQPLVVLILGGLTTLARPLALYLLEEVENRASAADRYSVSPATTYLDRHFRELLKTDELKVEYKQVNLPSSEKHPSLFAPPEVWNDRKTGWQQFDVVFDLTGELGYDKPDLVQISQTYELALNLARSAAVLSDDRKPKAYVRLTYPFYEMKSLPPSSPGHPETTELNPDGVRGRWWHETLRGLGRIAGLNTGVIRCGAWYGRGTWEGEIIPRVVVGHTYLHSKEEMKFLHNPDLRIDTVHTLDIAQALYRLSLYLISTPRETVMSGSAVNLAFPFVPQSKPGLSLSSKRSSIPEPWKAVPTVIPKQIPTSIPLFNITDDGDSTQDTLARAVAELWGIKYGFLSSTIASLAQQFAKTGFSEMIEDVNELHVEAWSEMLSESDPPIASSPISPYLEEHAFRKMSTCLDSTKAKRLLDFKPAYPKVEVGELRKIVTGFQGDEIWPRSK